VHYGVPMSDTEFRVRNRSIVLVDGPSMYAAGKDTNGLKVNYPKLLESLCASFDVVRAIAYVQQREGVNQDGFTGALNRAGYDIRIRRQTIRSDGKINTSTCKLMITVDALAFAKSIDTIILVAADGDYVALATAIKTIGCRLVVTCFASAVAPELKAASDLFLPIEEAHAFKDEKLEVKNSLASKSSYQIDYAGLPKDVE
jgi:uncharacterized LabA/DUF88 family protein